MNRKLLLKLTSTFLFLSCMWVTFANSCPEISRKSHPYGLKHPAFNCYVDNYWLNDNYQGGEREQDFLRVSAGGTGKSKKKFSNSISLNNDGDTALVLLYVNNSGQDYVLNSSNQKTFPYTARNGIIAIDWSNPNNIVGTITAKNTTPRSINDTVSIRLGKGLELQPLNFYYKNSKLKILKTNQTKDKSTFKEFKAGYKHAKSFYYSFIAKKAGSKKINRYEHMHRTMKGGYRIHNHPYPREGIAHKHGVSMGIGTLKATK